MPDIRVKVTPDFKHADGGIIVLLPLSKHHRLGGSALAHAFGQVGNDCPDLEDSSLLKHAFEVGPQYNISLTHELNEFLAQAVQVLIGEGLACAGHDRSDGGLLVTVLEMAFAGRCGVDLHIKSSTASTMEMLFAEELGIVLEIPLECIDRATVVLNKHAVPFERIGVTIHHPSITVRCNDDIVLDRACLLDLHDTWEATSFEIEKLQATESCVRQEQVKPSSPTSN